MSLGVLGKRLRREAAASPKKAALLGLVALVAVYFWTPLVWKWVSKSEQNVGEIAAVPIAVQNAVPSASAAISTAPPDRVTAPTRPKWPQILERMQKDPRTMIAPALTNVRDPFETAALKPAAAKAEEEAAPKPPVVTPDAAGLTLTGTIIGGQRRVAQINGKTYSVGQTVEAAKDAESVGAAFRLVEIHPRRAVLEADGQRFELFIPEPGKSERIDVRGERGEGKGERGE